MVDNSMKLDRKNVENISPLTNIQEGILFHYLMNKEKNEYFEQLSVDLYGNVDIEVFQKAWLKVVETNEMLRTLFRWENIEHPIQIVLKHYDLQIQLYDFINSENKEKELVEIKDRDRKLGFDLRTVSFRIMLCRIEEEKYEMIISSHHILYDGWSTGILLKEFDEMYSCIQNGKEPSVLKKTKFAEFIKWNRLCDDSSMKKFWVNYLKSYEFLEKMPVKQLSSECAEIYSNSKLKLDLDMYKNIKSFINLNQLTLAALIYSAWGILLQRYQNCDDVIFATVVSGRNCPVSNLENVVGLFINTLVTRVKTEESESIIELCKKINLNIKEKVEYEKTPLINLKKYLEIKNDAELFESIVVIDNYPMNMLSGSGVFNYGDFIMNETSNYDLTLGVMDHEGIELSLTYNTSKYSREMIEAMLCHLSNIIEDIITNLMKKVEDIDMLSPQEKDVILSDKYLDNIEFQPSTLVKLFEEQVNENYNTLALISDTGEKVSYGRLNEVANMVADSLINAGLVNGEPVAIIMEDVFMVIVSMLGVIKAGGVFTYIDTEYPKERILTILNEVLPSKILIDKNFKKANEDILESYSRENKCDIFMVSDEKVDERGYRYICIKDDAVSSSNPNIYIDPDSPAYIVYTSGSTGQPKGIVQSHKSFCQFLQWQSRQFNITRGECFFQWASITYDASYCEIFGSLCFGASLLITERSKKYDPLQLVKILEENNVTILQVVPSYFRQIIEVIEEEKKLGHLYSLDKLKNILFSGEKLLSELIWRWKEIYQSKHKITNLYGPTETVLATFYPLSDIVNRETPVYVGKVIDGRRILILDKNMRLCPINVPGEIYIQSEYLTLGYFKNPVETKKRFLKDPILPHTGPDVYRTGDIGMLLPDGNIQVLGRIDNQIKLNGMRVEIDEIERVLNSHETVLESAVVLNNIRNTQQMQLIAYIVPKKEIKVTELRDYFRRFLPRNMVPQKYVLMEKLPRTHSNKINKKELIQTKDVKFLQINEEKILPESETEKEIYLIWRELLAIDEIGVDENFFDIGGDSLLSMQLTNRLRSKFQQNITLKDFFKNQTIRGLANILNNNNNQEDIQEKIAQNLKKVMNLSEDEANEYLKKVKKNKV
ncbi:amino acid adenylation domain-containing protein [Clostridium frigidicarnis]|uniref:Amino acid adenylation domain-containing protein n=2 Tax=Clostridium frigidicarnis TaxID=84698 RepID=A0A1I1B5U7_9CLOT|nr:amino acid adenylation domain-containing protein [Clostridium frigidicarnis]